MKILNKLIESSDFDVLAHDDNFRYQLLSRMVRDLEYYFGNGGRSDKHLWAGNFPEQIQTMKDLWNSFDEKPEWLSMEQIEQYENKK